MAIKQGKGIVVSDLHMGRADTHAQTAIVEIAQQILAQKPSLLVLNGDIIEAKHIPGTKEQVLAACDESIKRIRGLVQVALQENPDCQIVFIYGNHDCYYEVAERLERLREEFPDNFTTEESLLRVRDTLFMHGDLQMSYDHLGTDIDVMKAGLRHRLNVQNGRIYERGHGAGHSRWKHVGEVTGAVNVIKKRVYNRVVGAADRLLSQIIFPIDEVAEAIYRTLKEHDDTATGGENLLDGIKNICIGHLHSPYRTAHEHEGVTFRVTGPATQFSKNTMYVFDINDRATR